MFKKKKKEQREKQRSPTPKWSYPRNRGVGVRPSSKQASPGAGASAVSALHSSAGVISMATRPGLRCEQQNGVGATGQGSRRWQRGSLPLGGLVGGPRFRQAGWSPPAGGAQGLSRLSFPGSRCLGLRYSGVLVFLSASWAPPGAAVSGVSTRHTWTFGRGLRVWRKTARLTVSTPLLGFIPAAHLWS